MISDSVRSLTRRSGAAVALIVAQHPDGTGEDHRRHDRQAHRAGGHEERQLVTAEQGVDRIVAGGQQ